MLQQVIQHHTPSDWHRTSYSDSTYQLYNVEAHSAEYNRVVAPFAELEVAKVQRVQNPYILGRFILRKEQLQGTVSVQEVRMYHPIKSADVDTVAEYNCDYRRCSPGASYAQSSSKKAKFYPSPASARQQFVLHGSGSNVCIVAVRVLDGSNTGSVVKDWDTEYCPEYFVFLEN